jgi:hypothetical protein
MKILLIVLVTLSSISAFATEVCEIGTQVKSVSTCGANYSQCMHDTVEVNCTEDNILSGTNAFYQNGYKIVTSMRAHLKKHLIENGYKPLNKSVATETFVKP